MSGCDPIGGADAERIISYFVERGEVRNAAMVATLRMSGARISEVVRCIRRRDWITADGELVNGFDLLMKKTARRKSNVFKLAVELVSEVATRQLKTRDAAKLRASIMERFKVEEAPRSYRRRRVEIHERYRVILADWLDKQAEQGHAHGAEWVFDLSRQAAWQIVKRAYKETGLTDGKYALHSWRGGLLEDVYDLTSELNRQGITKLDPLSVAKTAAGHTSRGTTEKYLKKFRGDENAIIQKVLTEC